MHASGVLQFVILSVLVNRCWEVLRCLTFDSLAATIILNVSNFCVVYNSAERQSLNPANLRISWWLLAPSPRLSPPPLVSCSPIILLALSPRLVLSLLLVSSSSPSHLLLPPSQAMIGRQQLLRSCLKILKPFCLFSNIAITITNTITNTCITS